MFVNKSNTFIMTSLVLFFIMWKENDRIKENLRKLNTIWFVLVLNITVTSCYTKYIPGGI